METGPANRGEMSQDSRTNESGVSLHPEVVSPRRKNIDPAARKTRRAFDALSASSVGLEMGLAVIIGLMFGYWLDRELGTSPWMMLLFLGFGLVAGFRGVIRAVGRAERAATAEQAQEAAHG
jgi:ATP synthase protein I